MKKEFILDSQESESTQPYTGQRHHATLSSSFTRYLKKIATKCNLYKVVGHLDIQKSTLGGVAVSYITVAENQLIFVGGASYISISDDQRSFFSNICAVMQTNFGSSVKKTQCQLVTC